MKRLFLVLTLLLILLISGCAIGVPKVNLLKHDEQKAIDTANHFLLDFIQGDYKAAFENQTNDKLKQATPLEKFNSIMGEVVRSCGVPTKASFDYFQPVPSQRAIQLFYTVHHEREGAVQYIFYLEGDAKEGYKITSFRVGKKGKDPQPYVLSNTRMGDDIFAEVTSSGINTKGKR